MSAPAIRDVFEEARRKNDACREARKRYRALNPHRTREEIARDEAELAANTTPGDA